MNKKEQDKMNTLYNAIEYIYIKNMKKMSSTKLAMIDIIDFLTENKLIRLRKVDHNIVTKALERVI